MGYFRKRPVIIEARQFDGSEPVGADIAAWINANGGKAVALFPDADGPDADKEPYIAIETLEGTMVARPRWWVIKGVAGEFYPCDPDIFHQTYEQAQL